MTQGFWVFGFSLPAGLPFFSLAASISAGLGSRRTKTSLLPSGDQAKSSTSWGVSVSRSPSPPQRGNSQTCVLPPSRAERKAMDLPSGLQRACDEDTPAAVRGIASLPFVETIQTRSSFLSSFSRAVSKV